MRDEASASRRVEQAALRCSVIEQRRRVPVLAGAGLSKPPV
jgi:hypothetical protein